jgi:hypothetical protein
LLFDRKSTRKPQLTEAGRGVLSEARTITNGIESNSRVVPIADLAAYSRLMWPTRTPESASRLTAERCSIS